MQEMVNLANGKRKLFQIGYNFVDVRDLYNCDICGQTGRTGQNYIVGGEYHLYYIAELMKQQLGRTILLATIPNFVSYLGLPCEYINPHYRKA